jgi:endoglucanase
MNKLIPIFLLPSIAFSANISNDIQGVGPNSAVKPYVCIQDQQGQITLALAPGQSGDGNKASGNPYYVGASLRFGGCTPQNSYLGYLGLSMSDKGGYAIASYTPPQSVHIAYQNREINQKGHLSGTINYTAIAANPNLSPAQANPNWQFAGVNLSGLEFGKQIDPTVIPNLSVEDADSAQSDLSETQQLIKAGLNTVRVPISWGFIQLDGPGKGDLIRLIIKTISSLYYNHSRKRRFTL